MTGAHQIGGDRLAHAAKANESDVHEGTCLSDACGGCAGLRDTAAAHAVK